MAYYTGARSSGRAQRSEPSVIVVFRVVVLAVLVTGLLDPRAALAIDLSEWVKGLKVTPYLGTRFEYETNVFQTPTHSQDDLIFKIIPGIGLEWTSGENSVGLVYRAEILRFLTLENQDATHHYVSGQLKLEPGRWRIQIREDFVDTTDPPFAELNGRVESITNVLNPEVAYRFTDTFALGLNGAWTHVKFPVIPDLD